jgi:hypothetical protein
MLKADLTGATALLDDEPRPVVEWHDGKPSEGLLHVRVTGWVRQPGGLAW